MAHIMKRSPLVLGLIAGVGFLGSTLSAGVADESGGIAPAPRASGLADITDKKVSLIAPLVDQGLVGSWQRYVPAGPGLTRLQFDINADGTYRIWSDNPTIAPQVGGFAADAGVWDWSSPTGADGGDYDLPDKDTAIITGSSGSIEWTRIDTAK